MLHMFKHNSHLIHKNEKTNKRHRMGDGNVNMNSRIELDKISFNDTTYFSVPLISIVD